MKLTDEECKKRWDAHNKEGGKLLLDDEGVQVMEWVKTQHKLKRQKPLFWVSGINK